MQNICMRFAVSSFQNGKQHGHMQTFRKFGLFIIAVIVLACFAHGQESARVQSAGPIVEMKRSVFYLNKIPIKLPIAAAELEKIIGKPDRTTEIARKVATWDKLGITGYQKTNSDEYIEIGFILNVTDNAFDFTPASVFNGSFVIDGAKITAASTRNSVNQKKTGTKFKPLPRVGILSDYKTGGIYLVMWQEAKRGASGSGKILQVNVGIAEKR